MFAPWWITPELAKLIPLDLLRFIPLILIMAYAAHSDWKTKEVPNKIWLYMPIGLTLTLIETIFFLNTATIFIEAISIAISCGLAYFLFAIGAWGGADAKALMTIAVSAPIYPVWGLLYKAPLFFSILPLIVFYVMSVSVVIYTITTKTNIPLKLRKEKFLPFMLIGLIVAVIL
jgi:archaeal preflagellin peptidase FlaK